MTVAPLLVRSAVARAIANAALRVAGELIDYRTAAELALVLVAKLGAALALVALATKARRRCKAA